MTFRRSMVSVPTSKEITFCSGISRENERKHVGSGTLEHASLSRERFHPQRH
jgi:hypothetical protein